MSCFSMQLDLQNRGTKNDPDCGRISSHPENPPGIRSFEEIREALADNLMMRFRRGENSDGL